MNKNKYAQYRELKDAGVDVAETTHVRPNAGSETFNHFRCKCAVAFLGQVNGYKVDSEVETSDGKEMDILLWGHESRQTYVVECETNWTEQKQTNKLNNYVRFYDPIDDMLMIEVLDVPESAFELLDYVGEQIGLNV
jgi:hypothetical protein